METGNLNNPKVSTAAEFESVPPIFQSVTLVRTYDNLTNIFKVKNKKYI